MNQTTNKDATPQAAPPTAKLPHRTTGHPFTGMSVSVRLGGVRTVADMSANCLVCPFHRLTKLCHHIREYSRGPVTSCGRA